MEEMDNTFKKYLPDTLYMSHYDLALQFNQFTAEEWRQYLRDNEKFIIKEVAFITEAEARKALSKLSTGTLTSQEVTAIKQILDRSEQINKSNQDARTFVNTFMPSVKKLPPTQTNKDALIELRLMNGQKVKGIYYPTNDPTDLMKFQKRIQNGEIIQNEDYSISIPKPTERKDFIYLGVPVPNLRT